jgi:hypothetical protein
MKPVSVFSPRVAPYVIGCPEPLIQQAVVDSAIQFCEDSMAIRQKLDVFLTTVGSAAYELDTPTDQRVTRIFRVWVGDQLAHPMTAATAVPIGATPAPPILYSTTRTDSTLELQLFPPPDRAYAITVEVALCPVRGAKSLQDDLFNLWVDPVCYGAIGQLMQVPGQAFSDPTQGAGMVARAIQLSRKAKSEATIGRVQTSTSITSRAFA